MILVGSYCFIEGGYGHMHFIQGEAGILYLLGEGIPRKGRSLAEGLVYQNASLAWGNIPGVMLLRDVLQVEV